MQRTAIGVLFALGVATAIVPAAYAQQPGDFPAPPDGASPSLEQNAPEAPITPEAEPTEPPVDQTEPSQTEPAIEEQTEPAAEEPTPDSAPTAENPQPTETTAADLVGLAYKGYFKEAGVPGYGSLADAVQFQTISAEDIVRAGVENNRIGQDKLEDAMFLSMVETQLNDLYLD
jgi:cytoskeletal protein RodZ